MKGERAAALSPFALALMVMFLAALMACAVSITEATPTEVPLDPKTIQDTLVEHTFELMLLPGVLGVGIGECGEVPCIKVLIVRESEELIQRLPSTLNGYAVDVKVVGEIDALEPE